MKIEEIKQNIVGNYSIANSNRYHISFVPKRNSQNFQDNVLYEGLPNPSNYEIELGSGRKKNSGLTSWLADEVNVPGFTVATGDVKGLMPGINPKYAHTKTFSEVNLSFILDHDHTPYKVLQKWGEYVFPHQETANEYIRTNYYDDYVADLIIEKIETRDNFVEPVNVVSRYELKNAFPFTLSAMTFTNGPNQPVRFQASFYFEYLREASSPQNVSGSKPNQGTQKKINGLIVDPDIYNPSIRPS